MSRGIEVQRLRAPFARSEGIESTRRRFCDVPISRSTVVIPMTASMAQPSAAVRAVEKLKRSGV
jgi:hypothetical protein